jgi:CHASE3 domain sensor protein
MQLIAKLSNRKLKSAAIFLAIELIYLSILFVLVYQTEKEMRKQLRSNTIISKANTVSKLFYDAGIAMAGYSITKNQLLSDRYQKIALQIPQEVNDLKMAIGKDKNENLIGTRLNEITNSGIEILNETKSQAETDRFDIAHANSRQMYKEIRALADHLSTELAQLTETEHNVERESALASRCLQLILNICFAFGFLLNIAIAFLIARCQRL